MGAVLSLSVNKSGKAIVLWLFTGCLLVFLMVVIGGITRLTGSGLSITEWNVIMGAVPPLNQEDWQVAFEKYRHSPQFQKVNFDMGIGEFKSIFLWEYLHRLIGRMIGIVFIVPFLYFLFTKKLNRPLVKKLLLLFALGGLQGFLGWFMVKSGLVDNPYVSHFRLAIHLITAFITFGFTFWIALDQIYPSSPVSINAPLKHRGMLRIILVLILVQIIYGAFVAGLHAGRIYNTFPKMGDEWVPEAVTALDSFWKNISENMAGVQFIHRCIAWILLSFIVVFWLRTRKMQLKPDRRKGVNLLLLTILIQFCLGLFTLIYSVPIVLAVLHQVGAFALFGVIIFLEHRWKSVQDLC